MRATFTALTLAAAAAEAQTTISFQNDTAPTSAYRGVRAVVLDGNAAQPWQPAVNYRGPELRAQGTPIAAASLMRWDVSSIPPSALVTAASITLDVSGDENASFPLYALSRSWAPAEVTWQQAANGTAWATAGALGIGSDRGMLQVGRLDGNGTTTIALNADGVGAVQGWVSGGTANHGVIVQSYTTSRHSLWPSSSHSTVSRRPSLRVTVDGGTFDLKQGANGYGGATDAVIANGPDPRTINHDGAPLVLDGQTDSTSVLLSFDVTQIPPGAIVQGVRLQLEADEEAADTYFIFALRRAWSDSSATWLTSDGSQAWQMPGATGANDRSATALGTVDARTNKRMDIDLGAAGVALVQGFVTMPATNFGFVLQDHTKTQRLSLLDEGDGNKGPRLTVTYGFDGGFDGPTAVLTPPDQTIDPGAVARIDASGSTPGTGTTLQDYAWALVEGPAGVRLTAGAPLQDLKLDEPGTYAVTLVVTDSSQRRSGAARATIVVRGEASLPRLGCGCSTGAPLLLLALALTLRRRACAS